MTLSSETVKACCASSYASEATRFLLGASFHPGGVALTRELLAALSLGPGSVLLDVASGPGTSALVAARETGCTVVGVELSTDNVERARAVAAAERLDRVTFLEGDAEALPLGEASVDAVLCECALCLFPDKPAAAREIARVLRPEGVVAISDVTADPDQLAPELRSLTAWASCVADARPLDEIASILAAAGLRVRSTESRSVLALSLVERIEGRLRVARMLGDRIPAELAGNIESGLRLASAARDAIGTGALGYGIVIASR